MNKIFIIGLPRTGTTSVSVALLEYGFKVAHTAFTKRAFEVADVVSDAPCFSDYKQLDALFPDSRFVYLDRSISAWLPSIYALLEKMQVALDINNGHFHTVLKRSFHEVFSPVLGPSILSYEGLQACYLKHQHCVHDYFSGREDFLSIDVSNTKSLSMLLNFIGISADLDAEFPHLNIGKQVDSWRQLKHPNKVNPTSAGKEQRKFFDYTSLELMPS